MDTAATKLYELSPTPKLFLPSFNNVLVRVPPFPLFLATPTIPHHLRHLKASAFQHGAADAATRNAYGVNTWLWQFGRGREHVAVAVWPRERASWRAFRV